MQDRPPITEWLREHRNGDAQATERLFAHFARRLGRLSQRHLASRVQRRVDSDDVVQSVFRSFFARDAQGRFEIENSLDLWKLLVTITLRKARKTWREQNAQRRSVQREASCDSDWLPAELGREPTVLEALIFVDEIESLVKGLSPEHARVLELRLAGCTPTEVAKAMGISRQAVYRLLKVLQERLDQRQQSPESERGPPAEL